MVRHNWKIIGQTGKAKIYVDYNKKKTKIISNKKVYIHQGIYPFHNYEPIRRFKNI